MAGKFVGFQILEKDAERGEVYPYPASAEDVAAQLRKMGYVVKGPIGNEVMSLCVAGVDIQGEAVELTTYEFNGESGPRLHDIKRYKFPIRTGG